MNSLELVRQIKDQVRDDQIACKLIEDLLFRAGEYVAAVSRMETVILCSAEEGSAYREHVQELDRNRTVAHNALIDAINICNRRLRSTLGDAMPPGGIYPEPDHISSANRRAIGDWAGRLVQELFCQRR